MVFFYTCSDSRFTVYMGRDKYENEQLIAYGHKEDLWFHVDNFSSAHVYLRTPWVDPVPSQIPDEIIEDMCQLVKNNSIEGCKASECSIVYTPWSNLRKDSSMDVGQIGYHDTKKCYYVHHVKTKKDIVKRMEKSKTEKAVDLRADREDRDRDEIHRKKKAVKELHSFQEEERKRIEAEKKMKSYDSMFKNIDKYRGQPIKAATTIEEARELEEDALW